MKKNQKILLGVAVVAALGLFLYNENKKKKKGEGYSNLVGKTLSLSEGGGAYGLGCKICERPNGTTYYAVEGSCEEGHKCITSVRPS